MEMTWMSVVAWVSIVLIHAFVYLTLGARSKRAHQEAEPKTEEDVAVASEEDYCKEKSNDDDNLKQEHRRTTTLDTTTTECEDDFSGPLHPSSGTLPPPPVELESILLMQEKEQQDYYNDSNDDDEQDLPWDGDEPQIFFRLLQQTGSEMTERSCSIRCIVEEQIRSSFSAGDEPFEFQPTKAFSSSSSPNDYPMVCQ